MLSDCEKRVLRRRHERSKREEIQEDEGKYVGHIRLLLELSVTTIVSVMWAGFAEQFFTI
jgi:hypothetical protein